LYFLGEFLSFFGGIFVFFGGVFNFIPYLWQRIVIDIFVRLVSAEPLLKFYGSG